MTSMDDITVVDRLDLFRIMLYVLKDDRSVWEGKEQGFNKVRYDRETGEEALWSVFITLPIN